MKRMFLLLSIFFVAIANSNAQLEDNIWGFGVAYSIHFTPSGPALGGLPQTIANYTDTTMPFYRSAAACNGSGQLLFYVKMRSFENNVPPASPDYIGKNIYDANGHAMANSDLVQAITVRGPVHIIKKPGNNAQYYVVYSLNYGLFSTTVDMDLNGGLGGVVAAEKGVMVSGWQTIVGEKTLVMAGCDCTWLVVRSRTANQYLSYRITEAGINPEPVVSTCGLLPLANYSTSQSFGPYGVAENSGRYGLGPAGKLKGSPDGNRIVACCDKGLELYRFHKCDGTLSDPELIDTTSTQLAPIYSAFQGLSLNPWGVGFYSACFSQDNSKLYATYMMSRHVYQYDLSLPTTAAVMASKLNILGNQPTLLIELGSCTVIDTPAMGDLKRGPDGKIYIANSAYGPCDTTTSLDVVKYYALHSIDQPNNAGLACAPHINSLILGYLWTPGLYETSVDFPPDMIRSPQSRDSLHSFTNMPLCNDGLLSVDTSGACYLWSTGQTTAAITVDSSGYYSVRWSGKDCSFHQDSFFVYVPAMPQVDTLQYGCPEDMAIKVIQRSSDTTSYGLILSDGAGIVSALQTSEGHRFGNLSGGYYQLEITTASGCDTTLIIHLSPYPKPELVTAPADTTIRYGDTIRIHVEGALLYAWSPSSFLDSATIAAPLAFPRQPTLYSVVGINNLGCRGTGFVKINIDFAMQEFIPNVFSPNGDGLNDVFNIGGIRFQKILAFDIYNRFGQRIFSTLDDSKGWDGRQHGNPCDAGTYYYLIRLAYPDGSIKTFKGDLTLIR